MRTPALLAALLVAVPLGVLPAGASVADAVPTGVDVASPQCGAVDRTGFAPPAADADFAVVGVNDGVGTTTNPCLAAEVAWARTLPGHQHSALELYVNTQHPAPAAARWWPRADLTAAGRAVTTPYGRCAGADDRACAWVYGASIADDDLVRAAAAGVDPVAQRWWLDVEVANSWNRSTAGNRAVLEGMAATLRAARVRIGVYSTHRQWDAIIGAVPAGSPLAGAATWLAGAVTPAGAAERCEDDPLVPRSRVELAQAVQAVDADVACGVLGRTPAPRAVGAPAVGQRLHVVVPAWSPAGVRFAYRWLRDGRPIARATGAWYRSTAADRHHLVAVQVKGQEPGYDAAIRTGAAVRIR